MTLVRLPGSRPAPLALAAPALATLALALLAAPPARAQLGPRVMGNSNLNLDTSRLGDELSIRSSDPTTHKLEMTRELQYLEPEQWKSAAVTWLRFRSGEDGEIVVTEEGSGVVRELEAPKRWQVEPLERGWKLTSEKGGGKLDLYLDTMFRGEPFKVGAVVPKFDGEAYGAVYRGVDFLFFVVQKKHPEPAKG